MMYSFKIVLTTPLSPSPEIIKNALELADKTGLSYCERGNNTISVLVQRYSADAAIVADLKSIRLVHNSKSYGFHPNMAMLRVDSLISGKSDRFIDVAGIKPGDKVLDCTCGLGSDAIVASYVVGEKGEVTAIEASPTLAAIVSSGLTNYSHEKKLILDEAMKRIKVINKDSALVLAELETDSWDIVYFDPMFDNTWSGAHGLDIVRSLASYDLPSLNTFREARRVASRNVLIKDRAPGKFLEKMNIPVVSKSKKVWYGVLN